MYRHRIACSLVIAAALAFVAQAATVTITKSNRNQTMVGFGTHTNIKVWKEKIGPFYQDIDLTEVGFYDSLSRDLNVIRTGMRSGANEHVQAFAQRGLRHFVMTSWSPPAEWKDNGESCCGGALLTQYYDDYAQYSVDRINEFKSVTGLDLYAYNFQNEPWFYEPYNSCIFDHQEYKNMLIEMGDAADAAGVLDNTLLMGPECMATYTRTDGVKNYTDAIMGSATAAGYLGALAVHGYKDGVEPDYGSASGWTAIGNRASQMGIPCWQTETDMPGRTQTEAMNMAGAIYVAVRYGNVSMFCKWTMCNSSDNALVADGVYLPGYYALAQYGRYVRDGAVRVDASSTDDQVLPLAFEDAGRGWFTVVLLNIASSSKTVNISGSGLPSSYEGFHTASGVKGVEMGTQDPGSITLPPNSITTLYAGVSTKVDPADFRPVTQVLPQKSAASVYDLRGRAINLFAPNQSRALSPGFYAIGADGRNTSHLHILPDAQQ